MHCYVLHRCLVSFYITSHTTTASVLSKVYVLDTYYSCYYPENEAYREKVAAIVNYFRQSGYEVVMDVMVSREISSQGPTRWAECQIRKAKKVLIFLSPGLVSLSLDEREGGYSQVSALFKILF